MLKTKKSRTEGRPSITVCNKRFMVAGSDGIKLKIQACQAYLPELKKVAFQAFGDPYPCFNA